MRDKITLASVTVSIKRKLENFANIFAKSRSYLKICRKVMIKIIIKIIPNVNCRRTSKLAFYKSIIRRVAKRRFSEIF